VISCEEADLLAAALSVGSIDLADQEPLQEHLADCADCRRVAGTYLAAAARMPLALEPLQPSPELRGRLMRAVYAEAAQAGRGVAAPRQAPWWQRLWAGLPVGRGFTALAAVAVVALVAVGSWSLANRPPASSTVAIAGTTAAPHAHGQLVYTPADAQGVLTVTGLPAPAAVASGASVYEVWLLRPTGSAVAAAFLDRQPDGTWTAVMHGSLSGFSTVAATAEPVGGSTAPSGSAVIQGSLNST
jgi:Anti-sigma-K factor rskA